MKKRIKFNITFGNKTFYLLLILAGLFIFAGIAIALQQWDSMGHSPTDIGIGTRSIQERLCAVEAALNMEDSSCTGAPSCTTNTECLNADSSKPYCVNGACVQCLSNVDCAAPQTCNLTTHSCVSGIVTCNLIGEVTGQAGKTIHKAATLPSDCMNGGTCKIKREVVKTTGTINKTAIFSQLADNTWTSDSGAKKGTNGNSVFSNIMAAADNTYIRDDCGDEKTATAICITIQNAFTVKLYAGSSC